MEKIFKFSFKRSIRTSSPLLEYTGTWSEMEMYYPNVLISNIVPVEEEELELA